MTKAAQGETDRLDVIDPDNYVRHGYPHETWARLRRESPVHFFAEAAHPYWAITKHEHITEIGKQPDLFLSGPRLVVTMAEEPGSEIEGLAGGPRPKTLIEMDNPRHRVHRKLISSRFTPAALKKIHGEVDRIARKFVDDMLEDDSGEVDFVEKIAAPIPIAVIAWLLGVPESGWGQLYEWTNKLLGFDDPEFNPDDDITTALVELFSYFTGLVEARKKDPKDDLISLFAHAEVDGEKLPLLDVLAWCQLIVTAGNETTRNATSGGMLALIEHEGERKKMEDPSNLRSGIEEILRWTSPIIHMARTASADAVIGGQTIKEGDSLALFYPSANRDESIFDDPEVFNVARKRNRHLAFGVGEHFCAGAHVARLELEMAYKYLLPRLEEVELASEPERLRSNFVGGIKRLPIRFKVRRA